MPPSTTVSRSSRIRSRGSSRSITTVRPSFGCAGAIPALAAAGSCAGVPTGPVLLPVRGWRLVDSQRPAGSSQAITLRAKLAEAYGASFDLAGQQTVALPAPSALLSLDSFPGLPADRIPRLHAVAQAAQDGQLSAERLAAMSQPEEARNDLRQLPGIGPFYSALIVIRACGHADVLSLEETMSRSAAAELYGWGTDLTDEEYAAFAERWRPFRTWAAVMIRAVGPRLTT